MRHRVSDPRAAHLGRLAIPIKSDGMTALSAISNKTHTTRDGCNPQQCSQDCNPRAGRRDGGASASASVSATQELVSSFFSNGRGFSPLGNRACPDVVHYWKRVAPTATRGRLGRPSPSRPPHPRTTVININIRANFSGNSLFSGPGPAAGSVNGYETRDNENGVLTVTRIGTLH